MAAPSWPRPATLSLSGAVTGGTLQALGGATLALHGAHNAAGSVLNNGTVAMVPPTAWMSPARSIRPSTGLFILTSAALLEVAACTGGEQPDQLPGRDRGQARGRCRGKIRGDVGLGTYSGPKLENFATADAVDLKNFVFATATIDGYSAATGLLQMHSGAVKATLLFDNMTLGGGTFHITADSGTGTMVTLG